MSHVRHVAARLLEPPAVCIAISHTGAVASRIAHLAVLDALFVAVCLADPDRARRTQALTADVITEHRI